jgi:branched-chain amino acid transport system substrate-binding protein
VIERLQAAAIDVVFIGGYHTEVGLIARAARDRGYPVQLVVGPSLATEEFGLIAGDAAEGTLFTFLANPRRNPEAAPVVERFRATGFEPEGYTLYAYAAVQVWAEAAEQVGTLDLEAMIATLRDNEFASVLGLIDFDDKGDVTTQAPIWHVWRGGEYMPLALAK